jgi:hypothetical protein
VVIMLVVLFLSMIVHRYDIIIIITLFLFLPTLP